MADTAINLIYVIRDHLNGLIDWFTAVYYFVTEYIDDPFSEDN